MSDRPTKLVYLRHVKVQLAKGAFQFASVDITNKPNVGVVFQLFSTVVQVYQFEVRSIPKIEIHFDLVM